jgi:hypothetical protein
MRDEPTRLQDHIYQLTVACLNVMTAGHVVFHDATALPDFKAKLPDMVQAIQTASHVVMAYTRPEERDPQ